ncbi:hypothetical protein NX821_001520 [Clostridium septicum]|uniref:DUF3502 domain-containing protein n=1 Tax=Clostridium septicum TaxID=1504 RepID=UPI003217518A
MRKKFFLSCIIICCISFCFSCTSNTNTLTDESKEKITEIVIARFTNITNDDSINKFNKILKDNNIPYSLKFIQYAKTNENGTITNYKPGTYMESVEKDKNKIDLFVTNNAFETDFDYLDMIKRDLAEPLDNFLKNDGIAIYNSIPEESWNSIRINNNLYSLPMYIGIDLHKKGDIYYGIKRIYADKYGIDISTWGSDFWNHKDELDKIIQGEKENKSFSLFSPSLISYIVEYYPGYTPVVSVKSDIHPYVYDEKNKEIINIYESEPILKINTYFREFYNNNNDITYAYNDSENENVFTLINTNDSYYIKKAESYLQKDSIYDIAICKASEKKNEVYDFLNIIYTDKNIIQAIEDCFGTNGIVIGNGFYDKYSFNNSDINDIKNGYSELNKSDIYGFVFDPVNVSKEMSDIACYLYEKYRLSTIPSIKNINLDEDNKVLHQLGIDKVLDEMNRQINEFKNNINN